MWELRTFCAKKGTGRAEKHQSQQKHTRGRGKFSVATSLQTFPPLLCAARRRREHHRARDRPATRAGGLEERHRGQGNSPARELGWGGGCCLCLVCNEASPGCNSDVKQKKSLNTPHSWHDDPQLPNKPAGVHTLRFETTYKNKQHPRHPHRHLCVPPTPKTTTAAFQTHLMRMPKRAASLCKRQYFLVCCGSPLQNAGFLHP